LQRAGWTAGAFIIICYNGNSALAAAAARLTLFVLVHLTSAWLTLAALGTVLLLARIMLGVLLPLAALVCATLALLSGLVLTTLVLVRHTCLANCRGRRAM
jgi:hypothetical protein